MLFEKSDHQKGGADLIHEEGQDSRETDSLRMPDGLRYTHEIGKRMRRA
jgi:hypothetical protein